MVVSTSILTAPAARVAVPEHSTSVLGLENRGLRLELEPADGSLTLLDKNSGVRWSLGSPQVELNDQRILEVRPVRGAMHEGEVLRYAADDPVYRDPRQEPRVTFELRLSDDPPAIGYSFTANPVVREVRLLHRALRLKPGIENYYVIPHRMGVLLPVEGEKPFSRRLIPYTIFSGWPDHEGPGYSMAMFGAVQDGSALLVSWEGLYTDILYEYATQPHHQLSAGVALYRDSRSIRLQPLGRGGYVEIAKAYRPLARQRGFLQTLVEKVQQNPALEQMVGAADFKPFVFSTRVPHTRWNKSDKESIDIHYRFADCTEFAEHMKNDLGIDGAMLVLAGWNHRGYDRSYPDILPAAPELGGDAALSECCRRVKALGWLFGLHDNYRDVYKDAPSWSEDIITKKPDGSLQEGYEWNGGQAYLACSGKALEIAARPQNLAGVQKLFAPNLYFIDTTFASPPYECFDPKHPVSPAEDVQNKIRLADYARKLFGLFSSEEGKEWAVSHADYFEGLLNHKTRARAPMNAEKEPSASQIVIPLFELVYGDSILIYSHQDGRARPDDPARILDHILYAQMPVYNFGGPRYWADAAKNLPPAPGAQARLVFAQGGRFGLTDQFIKNTYEVLSPLKRQTALLPMTDHRFVTPDRQVEATRFGNDVNITVNYGEQDFEAERAVLPQYGFVIESPTLVAFYARSYRGMKYAQPPLFVLRSLDGQPLSSSRRVRIYHAFGDHRLEWKGKIIEVETERVAP
jgi:hypothetical protein